MVALSRNLSRKHAMEMLLTGDMVSAEDAAALGLINRMTVPAEKLADETRLAGTRRLPARPPLSSRSAKRRSIASWNSVFTAAYDYASEVMTHNMLVADAEEGI